MTLLVTACLLPGGINKEHFSGEIVVLALLSCDLPRHMPRQIESLSISLRTKVPWKMVPGSFTVPVLCFCS